MTLKDYLIPQVNRPLKPLPLPLLGENLRPIRSPDSTALIPTPPPGPGSPRSEFGYLYSIIPDSGGTISTLGGVAITTPANNDVLSYNSGTTNFVNTPISSLIGGPYLPIVGGTITGTPGTLIVNAPNAATGPIFTAQVNGSARLTVSADSDHILSLADASTTGPTATLRLFHKSTAGTPSVGFGSQLQFWGEDDSGTAGNRAAVEYATIRTEASSTAAGAVSSDWVVINKVGGTSTEALRVKGSDGRSIFAGAVQTPALHVGDLVTHPATVHISRASGAADPTVQTYLKVKSVADTGLTGNVVDVHFDLTTPRSLAVGGGTLAAIRPVTVEAPTYTAASPLTITEASGVYLNSLPIPGANVTMTERFALYVNGPSQFAAGSSGGITYVWKLPTDNTPVGAAVGRIPINIGGVVKYIPYHSA